MKKTGIQINSTTIVCFLLSLLPAIQSAFGTALDDYVAISDANYAYSLRTTVPDTGYTGYVLDVNSQDWRSLAEVDRTLWQHLLYIAVPTTVSTSDAMLFVSGGSNGDAVDPNVFASIAPIAVSTGSVVSYLEIVPNQPLYFTDESIARSEDAIIAYSWDKYLNGGDANWPAQLPMVKSAVRAMDTVQSFCAQPSVGSISVDDFVIAGGSKRGWTSWLTAAVDSRIIACVPIVIDILNLELSFRHHHAAYGYWSPAVDDYEQMGIFDWFGTEQCDSLMKIVDPYEYRDRLTMPKYCINSTGDEFFLPDSSQFYFDDLTGVKYLRYVPNSNHSLDGSDAFESMTVFYQAVLADANLPDFSWEIVGANTIRVQTDPANLPNQVNLWQATNTSTRDFRLAVIGAAWTSSALANQGDGLYVGSVAEPPTGWRAFFIELIYNSGLSYQYKFTTEVKVVPEDLPFICDFDFDGTVTMTDLGYLLSYWLTDEQSADIAPSTGNGTVNLPDFAYFASHWDKP